MSEGPTQMPEQPQAFGRVTVAWNRVAQLIPLKARLAVFTGSLVLIALLGYTLFSSGTATLNLICRDDLHSAEIAVSMDGKSIYTEHISASPKKVLFDVIGKKTATLSKSLAVPSGEHVVQVHLTSDADKFDQTEQRQIKITAGSEGMLLVSAERSGMSVSYKPSVTAEAENGSSYSALVRSMIITVFGSAVSAAIGFVVQEFLRSKRAV